MMNVLTIGSATQDSIARIDNISPEMFSPSGKKIDVHSFSEHVGGGATNAAVSFSRLGFCATALYKIGNDAQGTFINQSLSQLVTTHPIITDKAPTGRSIVIPTSTHDRIIFAFRGANETLVQNDIPLNLLDNQQVVYFSALSKNACTLLPHIAHKIKQQTPTCSIIVNPGTNQLTFGVSSLKATLSNIDILILNAREMKLFMLALKHRFFRSSQELNDDKVMPPLMRMPISSETITFTLFEYCKEILSYGVKRVVVTHGKQGVYVATKNSIFFHPALPTSINNTIGAGDAFGSTFVGMLMHGARIEDAIRYAIYNSSNVVSVLDAQSGLLTKQELLQNLSKVDNNLLKKYSFPS